MMEIPSFLQPYLVSDAMVRLKGIDMNCGVNMTSFPLFVDTKTTNRFDHSLFTALCAWHFTKDRNHTLACLFHDIATPVFSHTVDLARGDYMIQEATEMGIWKILENDPLIRKQLNQDDIRIDDVYDYHQYSVCDNSVPQLCCDRLSYLLTGMIELGFGTKMEAEKIFADITVAENEYGRQELCFLTPAIASLFAQRALQCGIIYSCCFDRYAMEILGELITEASRKNILSDADLYTTESEVICKLKHSSLADAWQGFTDLYGVQLSQIQEDGYRQIRVKKRYVDPYVVNMGRITKIDKSLYNKIQVFVSDNQSVYINGLYKVRERR